METMQEIAGVLKIDPANLERESLKTFLEKELKKVEACIYEIGTKHGINSVLELDEKLKSGKIKEEDVLNDFIELDQLETKRDELLISLKKIR